MSCLPGTLDFPGFKKRDIFNLASYSGFPTFLNVHINWVGATLWYVIDCTTLDKIIRFSHNLFLGVSLCRDEIWDPTPTLLALGGGTGLVRCFGTLLSYEPQF